MAHSGIKKEALKAQEYSTEDLQFLLKASNILGSSIDYHTTLKNVANLSVEKFADWGVVHISDKGNQPARFAVAHRDPKKVKFALKLQKKYPEDRNEERGVYHVIKTGVPEYMSEIPQELLLQAAKDEEHKRIILELGLVSYMCVPIKVRGKSIGAITFFTSELGRKYEKADVDLAQNLADQAAHAIENALLYKKAQQEIQKRKLAEKEVKGLNKMLELKVVQRTSELVERNKELAESEGKYRTVVASMHEGIILQMKDGTVKTWNKSAETILGLNSKQLRQVKAYDQSRFIMYEDGRAITSRDYPALVSLRTRKPIINVTMGVKKPNGQLVWVNVNSEPLFKPGQKMPYAVVTSFTDITKRKEHEEAIKKINLLLQQSNAELESFASVASHDLQEPLRKIRAFGDRLRSRCSESLTEEGQDYLNRMLDVSSRMQQLIEDLLSFSRIATSSHPFESVNLNDIMRDVLSDLEVRVEDVRAKVEVSKLPTIESDPIQIRQLLQNLISNALKFHRKDHSPEIKIYANGKSDSSVTIYVQDNGIGFEEKYKEKIFQMFQRLHGRESYQGTGIGLAICRKIVERHSGFIDAKSSVGKGTTFMITFPKKQKTGGDFLVN